MPCSASESASTKSGRGREPVHRLLGERAREHGVHGLGQVGLLRGGRDDLVDVGGCLGGRRLALEGAPAGEELVGDDGQRVAVACGRRLVALRLLGGEVAGRSEHGPRRSHAGRLVDDARDPEVDDLEPVGAVEEEVRRLDVSMDDAVAVRGVEGFGRLREPGERLLGVDAAAPGADGQCPAREMLHDRERPTLVLADVEDRDHVRLAGEPGGGQRLAAEADAEIGVLRQSLRKELDGHDAVELAVVGDVDLAHAAAAHEAWSVIAIREDAGGARHRPRLLPEPPCVQTWHPSRNPYCTNVR